MSFRYGAYSRVRKLTAETDDDLPCSSSVSKTETSAGERAWDYLLRRRAEDINDRIHRTNAVEFSDSTTGEMSQFYVPVYKIKKEKTDTYEEDGCSPRLKTSDSSGYVPNEGFWVDRTGERFDQEMFVRVKSEFDEHKEGTWGTRYDESEAPRKYPKLLSQYSSNSHHSAFSANQACGRSIPTNQQFEEALVHNVSSYVEDARRAAKNHGRNAPAHQSLDLHPDAYEASRQNYGRKTREKTSIHNRARDVGDEYHFTDRHCNRNAPVETSVYSMRYNEDHPRYAADSNERSHLSDQAMIDSTFKHTEDTRHAEMETYGRRLPVESSARNMTNDYDDLRQLLKNNSRRKFPVNHPSDSTVTCNTQNSAEDAACTSKQKSSKNRLVSAGNHTLFHSLPYPAEGVEVVYTTDPVEAEAWLRNNIIDCSVCAVGFDIEWKPQYVSKKKGGTENKTAVLQLGVESSCLVLHLWNMKTPPKLLASVLSDEKILKVGSGILQDVAKLKRDTGLKCVGLVDTQTLAKSVGIPASQKLGLQSLALRFLGIQLDKPKSVSKSNWEKYPLTVKQINYAALDAWIGLKIYQHLKGMYSQSGKVQVVNCFAKDEDVAKPGKTTACHNNNNEDVKKPGKTTACYVCNKKVKDENALVQHIKIHPRCKCGEHFMVKISKRHKRECPALNPATPVDVVHGEPNTCQGCGKKCKEVEKLIEHIREVGHVLCPFCTRLMHSSASHSHIRKCKNFISEQWKEFAK